MEQEQEKGGKLGVASLVLMIFSVIFGFGNHCVAFFRMGLASIIWYVFGAFVFFLPFMFVSAEYAVSFKNEGGGGMYTWMRKSRGELYGFLATFMWYFSIVIWLTGISARIWVPISSFVFGEDRTKTWTIFGLDNTKTIGIMGILLIVGITYFATKGFNKVSTVAKIGGISCTVINITLYIVSLMVLALNKGFFEEPIKGIETFIKSPNPSHTPITLIGFITFAIFAYGGIEGLGSLVEKAKSAKTFSKACIFGTLFIAFGYCAGIFCWGISANYNTLQQGAAAGNIHMGNITYVLMRNLGCKLGLAFGASQESALALGKLFMRIVGLSMLLGFLGAIFTLIYSPVKTLIDGAPKKMWPESFMEKNKADMPHKAMWTQALIVCTLIAIISFFGKALGSLFDLLQLLSNIAQCIPYIFMIAAFPAFRKNDDLDHSYTIFKSKSTATIVSTFSFIIITIATIFTIIEPAIKKEEDGLFKTIFMIIAPVAFFIIAFLIFSSYKKRLEKDNIEII